MSIKGVRMPKSGDLIKFGQHQSDKMHHMGRVLAVSYEGGVYHESPSQPGHNRRYARPGQWRPA